MKQTNSHVPQHNDAHSDYDHHYSREEREKLMNAPKKRKYNKKLKYMIMALDLVLVLGAYMCVKHYKDNDSKKQDTPVTQIRKSSVFRKGTKYTFVSDLSGEKAELKLIIKRRDNKFFALSNKAKMEFIVLSPKGMKKKVSGKIYDTSTEKLMHIYHHKFKKDTIKKANSIGARYYNGKDKEPIELVLE